MPGDLILAAAVSCAVLLPAAVVLRRTEQREPGDAGECTGEDCRQCAHLLRHPAQAPTRAMLREGIKRQTRKGW
ncbi:hypothetical protein [Streptomyces sp. KAU_LT]|uniref:hypothetical protein n=1 Tax=Streptomyces sp. KAU_LT TaxID=3046669 RepID=UPI0024B7BA10|nr:hypothetical protein [Streptomyces sp. KAU_LT]MDI9836208.1 hypothetical protein [Streptomyces sp. KAU_LT]